MNRKSALNVRESGRDWAGKTVNNRSAVFAAGREQPVFIGNSKYFLKNPVFNEQDIALKPQFPKPKFQLSTNYQSIKRRTPDCLIFLSLAFGDWNLFVIWNLVVGICPVNVRLSTNKFQTKIIKLSVIHAFMQKVLNMEVETMFILKVKARRS